MVARKETGSVLGCLRSGGAEGLFSRRMPRASRWDTGTLNPKSFSSLASLFLFGIITIMASSEAWARRLGERYYSPPFVHGTMFELRNKGEQLVPPVGSLPIPLGIQDLFISAHTLHRLLPLPIFKSLVNIIKEKIKAIPRAQESYLPYIKEGKKK